jgi:hypothetical protein
MPERKFFKKDEALETLIDLDGEIFLMGNGFV